MTWLQELRDLGADEISNRLGGRKDGEWWRLPYLCKGERTLTDNPGFVIKSDRGWIRAYCHHCEAPGLLRLVYEALFGRAPEMPNERRSDLSIKTGKDLSDEVVNGWPMLPESVKTSYDSWLKDAIALHGKVQFTCQYHAANGDLLESVREEPGKRIWGKGSNSQLNPLPLLWPAGDYYNGMVVIAEGEKAAAALRSHGYNAISWRGGKSAWKHTRWEHEDSPWHWFQTIVLWPDWEDASMDAFYQLGLHLPKEGSRDFLIVDMPADFTEKRSADAADFTEDEVFVLLQNHIRTFSDWASTYVPTAPPHMDENGNLPEVEDDNEVEEIPSLYKRGGYYDVERMLHYLRDDLAYVQAPTDRGLSTTLGWCDNIGYWHPLNDERNTDWLATAISEARVGASLDVILDKGGEIATWKPATRQATMKFLESMPNRRELQEAATHLTTRLRQNQLFNNNRFKPLPQFTLENRRKVAAEGLLTFREEVISLPEQSRLRKADVREYGLIFDEGWSNAEWQYGAYERDTPQAAAVRTLIQNLGDFPLIVAEMLAGMDRRIAILHSKTSGVGKSMFTGLLKSALGSMIETGQPGELTKRAMGSQFPNLNNHLTRCRVLVIPEVNTAGLENINFGKLVHLTGESHLTTERKYMEQVTLPRTGNVLLTMGEVQKTDAKGNPSINWHEIQGLEARLRVWDIDAGGGKFIPHQYFEDANTWEGRLAFVDWLVQSMGDGKPDSATNDVMEHTQALFNTSRDVPLKENKHEDQVKMRDYIVGQILEWTDEYDPPIDVCDLAMLIEPKVKEDGWSPLPEPATNQAWLASIRRAFDLPSLQKLEIEGEPNRLRVDRNQRRNWPLRGFRFKEADEYGNE